MGGLHDYISTLADNQVIDYILEKAQEFPELGRVEKLNELVATYGITAPVGHSGSSSIGEIGINLPDTIENKLAYTDRATLNKFALATEKFDREFKGIRLMGGLHDYIKTLADSEVITYILTKVKTYPELGNVAKLGQLVQQYGIKEEASHTGEIGINLPDTIENKLAYTNRDTLNKYAIAVQKYHRQVNNQRLMGGIDDYINTLSDSQVIDYIRKETTEHPEIATISALDQIVTKFNVQGPHGPVRSNPVIGGGLHDVVRSLDRKSLISFALAMDEYSHEKNPRLGGIDDYVYTLQDQEIANFILKQAEQYPELNSRSAVSGLVTKYNITVRDQ